MMNSILNTVKTAIDRTRKGFMMRRVRQIYRADSRHWVGDGFWVQPLFSHMGEDRGTNPFLMLDYAAPHVFAPTVGQARGVGQHPHKGFETVTICYQGEVAHRDSTGGGGIIKAGDVQWMTAGAGIIHEEFHSEAFSQRGGVFEMVQLWVNLPAKNKNTPARYQYLAKESIPVVPLDNNAGHLRLIAGEYKGVVGAADTFTEMNVWDGVIHAAQEVVIDIPAQHQLSVVVLRGALTFHDQARATEGLLVGFDNDGGSRIQMRAGETDVRILLLSGVPINEPVVGYGPFVMNSKEEIHQAIDDYNQGRFGAIG